MTSLAFHVLPRGTVILTTRHLIALIYSTHSNIIKNSEGRHGIEGNTSRKEDAELVLDEERIRRRSTGETLISPISFLLSSSPFVLLLVVMRIGGRRSSGVKERYCQREDRGKTLTLKVTARGKTLFSRDEDRRAMLYSTWCFFFKSCKNYIFVIQTLNNALE
jgi:hypothetical protein